jgi:TonB-dependent starch-binding outer membrane protein SusC
MNKILRTAARTTMLTILVMLVSASVLVAQTRTISGVIKDDTGLPLPGASVIEKGTTNGSVTDADGKFSITVSSGATLIISFLGMQSKEIVVGEQTTLDISLESDIKSLEEIVVIGYGTAKKSDLTGAVVSVTGDDLKKMPVSTIAESLTGRMAGVSVSATEGSPDAEIRIRVRGGTSISQDNTPLYIVDGFPVRSISDISPSDIKNITVLKDASSTAIYGSRGANGVVLITTKSGNTDGKLSVSYNTFVGTKKLAKELDVLSPEDYVKWQYEYAMLRNSLTSYEDYFGLYQDIDLYDGLKGNNWQQQVYGRTGKVFSHDLSVRGGIEKFSYSANYARYQERSIMVGSDYNRDNLTLKLNSKPNDKVDFGFSVRYSRTEVNGGGANEQNEVSSADSRLKHSVTYAPLPLDGLTTDDTNDQIAGYLINPLTATADNDRLQQRRNYNLGGSFGWNVIENLQLRIEGGIDTYHYQDNRFYGLTTYFVKNRPAGANQNRPAAVLSDRKENRFRNTNTLTYNFKKFLGSNHHLNLLIGEEMLKNEVNQVTSELHGYPTLFTSDDAFRLTTQGIPVSVDNYFNPDDKLISFFARANYDYLGRYLLTATYRADGSSKFLGSNRWGYFPSASAAWKISEENFMSGTKSWLNALKLRASYGEAGNNNIPTGQTAQNFASSNPTWLNGITKIWTPSKTMANPDLKWETTITRNIGIDFDLLKGRISGTIDLYKNTTEDLLIRFPTPGTGYDDQYRNLGETQNKGIEVSLNYQVLERTNYGLNFAFNISFNRSEIISIGSMDYIPGTSNWASTAIGPDYRVNVGSPLGLMYGYRHDGRYEVSDFDGYDDVAEEWILKEGVADVSTVVGTPAPGMMKLKDLDGDGLVTTADKEIIGNVNPNHTGGFILNGYAYGFDLTGSFNWSYGNDVYNANKIEYTTATPQVQYRNLEGSMAEGKRWTNIDPLTGAVVTDPTQLQTMNANTTMWSPLMDRYVFSDWAVEKGSFLRLNTLTVGYTLPSKLMSKLKIKSLRLYATGYNVFVLTNYTGFDPEVSTRRNTPYTPGVDYSAYPRSRQYVLGLNLNF